MYNTIHTIPIKNSSSYVLNFIMPNFCLTKFVFLVLHTYILRTAFLFPIDICKYIYTVQYLYIPFYLFCIYDIYTYREIV